jgi:hypothetical protein
MQNVGDEEFTYDSFKQAYDSDSLTQGLTQRFDQNGLELKTKVGNNDVAPSDAKLDGSGVTQMAKHALKRARG